jgi:hypothetical protein
MKNSSYDFLTKNNKIIVFELIKNFTLFLLNIIISIIVILFKFFHLMYY